MSRPSATGATKAAIPSQAATLPLHNRQLLTGTLDLGTAIGDQTVVVDGDPAVLGELVALLAPVDPNFDIVTP